MNRTDEPFETPREKVPRIKVPVKLKHGRGEEIARRHEVSGNTVRQAAKGLREVRQEILRDITATARRDAAEEQHAVAA